MTPPDADSETVQRITPSEEQRFDEVFRRSWSQRFFDSLYGYDYFISYHHEDGADYALPLAEQLKGAGFDCFLDRRSFVKGDNWKRIGRYALLKTSRLVLVGSPTVYLSEPVAHELEIFAGTGKRIIPINIGGCLQAVDVLASPIARYLDQEALWIAESADRLHSGPAPQVIEELRESFDLERQTEKRAQTLRFATLGFAALSVLALSAAIVAGWKWSQEIARNRELRIEQANMLRVQGALFESLAPVPETGGDRRLAPAVEVQPGVLPEGFRADDDLAETGLRLTTESLRRLTALGAETGLADGAVRRFMNLLPRITRTFAHAAGVAAIEVIPQSDLLAVASGTSVVVWSRSTGAKLFELKHPQAVVTMRASPDGKLLATGSQDRFLRVWDLTRQPSEPTVYELPVAQPDPADALDEMAPLYDEGTVALVAISPDGKWVAAAHGTSANSSTNQVHVWSLRGDEPEFELESPSQPMSLAFSHDGARLAVGAYEGDVTVWEIPQGTEVFRREQKGLESSVISCVAFGPGDRMLASGGADETVRIWSVPEGKQLHELRHTGAVMSLAFSSDGSYLAAASLGKTVRTWWLTSWDDKPSAHDLPHEAFATAVAFADVGHEEILVTATSTPIVRAWSVGGSHELLRRHSPSGAFAVPIDGEGKLYLAVSGHRVVALDLRAGASAKVIGDQPSNDSLYLTRSGMEVIAQRLDGRLTLWDSLSGTVREKSSLADLPSTSSADEVLAISGSNRGAAILCRKEGRLCRLDVLPSPFSDRPIALSSDGARIALRLDEQTIGVWTVRDGHLIGRYRYQPDKDSYGSVREPLSLALDHTGRRLALADRSKVVRLWDVVPGSDSEPRLIEEPDGVFDARFADGKPLLLTTAWNDHATVYNAVTRTRLLVARQRLQGQYQAFASDVTAITPQGVVATVFQEIEGADVLLEIYRPPYRTTPLRIPLGKAQVRWLVTDPRGRYVAVVTGTNEDRPALYRVWELSSGRQVVAIPSPVTMLPVVFSDDSRWLITLGRDGARWWPLEPSDVIAEAERRTDVLPGRRAVGGDEEGESVIEDLAHRLARRVQEWGRRLLHPFGTGPGVLAEDLRRAEGWAPVRFRAAAASSSISVAMASARTR
jgi:WD40 repeat protein